MKVIKYTILFAVMSCFGMASANAQDTAEPTLGADFVSQYIWRGTDCGNISVQPSLGVSYKGLSVSAWGSVGFDASDTKEFDLTVAYSAGGFNIGVTDYWFNAGGDVRGRYFMYKAHSTNHIYEANVGYDFGPLSLQWFTNFAGNDGAKEDGKRAYSSYFEVSAPFSLATLDWTASVGLVPWETDFYGTSGFAITNIALGASKEIKLTESLSMPVFANVSANPCSQHAYFVVGFSLIPQL